MVAEPVQLRNLRLFVASPGGVEDERRAVRRLVDELNVALRRHGWQIEVLGWEDRGPASGRAQADINADVERCDLFLGVVWDRWGTPTGQQSSGFAEEWALASDRWRRTGAPELWLCFKHVELERQAAPDEQLRRVMEFRRQIESEELAFYKPFASPAELEVVVRTALLDEIFKRAGPSQQAIGVIPIDWASALAHEPIALLADGAERERLAAEFAEKDPESAAEVLVGLAAEVDELGFVDVGEDLRDRAAAALDAAGHHGDALSLWRRLLRQAVEASRLVDARLSVDRLRDRLPPEQQWEAAAWQACLDWPTTPERSVPALLAALSGLGAHPVDVATRRLWRRTLWELWLALDQARLVVSNADENADDREELDDDLLLLRADALALVGEARAAAAWQEVRARSLDVAEAQPGLAARLWARWAVRLAEREEWTAAQEGFVRAAALWGRVEGAEEQAAECFFSAQVVGQLSGEWVPSGWSWRGLAASVRGASETPAARAAERERSALAAHVRRSYGDARQHLAIALAINRRSGHLGGSRRTLRMLGDVERDGGEGVDAVLHYCEAGVVKAARDAAAAASPRDLTARLRVGRTMWETRASCAVLGRVGRHATEAQAACLLPDVLSLDDRRARDDGRREPEAAAALAQLCVALDDADAFPAIDRLLVLLASGDFVLEQAGSSGLRMLTDLGRFDATDALVKRFARARFGEDVSPQWVAQHLVTPRRVALVRESACGGDPRAMLALGLAGLVAGDEQVRDACCSYLAKHVESDLGRTQDGKGLHGLMALDLMAAVAVHCPGTELRRAFADMLLLYRSRRCGRW